MIIYFSLRIFTLSLYSYSTVFERYEYGSDDSNFTLIFLIISNFFIYAGLYVVRLKNTLAVNLGKWRAASPDKALFLILFSMLFIYSDLGERLGGGIGRLLGIVTLFFNPGLVLLMVVSYYWLFRKSFSRRYSFLL